MDIPKVIYQTWKTKDISEEFASLTNSWKQNNPQYKYVLYDDSDCQEFIKTHFSLDVYNAYTKIIPGAYKADLWRYCILYINGGVYVDIDTICLGSIDEFLTGPIKFMTPIDLNISYKEGNYNLFNTFIASVAKSEILLGCINEIAYNVLNNRIPDSKLDFSGPGVLGRNTNKYMGLAETTSFVGKEGLHNDGKIKFLKFERYGEYVTDNNKNRLFQNKCGNWHIMQTYNAECAKAATVNWVTATEIIKQEPVLYSEFFVEGRKRTFEASLDLILLNRSIFKYNIVELGTTRSFVSGYIESNKDKFNKYDPRQWDWGAGNFTKVFSDNLNNYNFNYALYTVDPCEYALSVSRHICLHTRSILFLKEYSSNFLNRIDFNIDYLYMDHMESSEEACQVHLEDTKILIKRNLISKNGMVLIDDAKLKGKYSIPLFLDSGFKILLENDAQVLLLKI